MNYVVRYSAPEDVTNPGYDGRMIGFAVAFVPEEFVDAPEEEAKTTRHRLVVRIDGTTLAVWKLTEHDLIRVLFHHARRFLSDALKKNEQFGAYTVDGPLISVHSTPRPAQLDPRRIPAPEGFSETITVEKRMGFGAP